VKKFVISVGVGEHILKCYPPVFISGKKKERKKKDVSFVLVSFSLPFAFLILLDRRAFLAPIGPSYIRICLVRLFNLSCAGGNPCRSSGTFGTHNPTLFTPN